MWRRDYTIRLIERIAQMLAGVREQRAADNEAGAGELLDKAFQELAGMGPEAVSRLSETELLAQLMRDVPTQVVRRKSQLLAELLEEAAGIYAGQGREDASRSCRIKALDLLLSLQLQDTDLEMPELMPKIGAVHDQLGNDGLPLSTLAGLWRHYERTGAFARAEDVLFALLEAEPENPALKSEGRAFYERLLRHNDANLEAGNLPRAEVEAGLAELGGLSTKGGG